MHLLLILDGECHVSMDFEFLSPDLTTTRHYALELGATINLFSIKMLWSENFATAHEKFWAVQSSIFFCHSLKKYISFILVSFVVVVVVCSGGDDGGVSVCVYIRECVYECGGQCLTFCFFPKCSTLIFWDRVLWIRSFLKRLDCWISQLANPEDPPMPVCLSQGLQMSATMWHLAFFCHCCACGSVLKI